ncbi:arginine deiminase family protein [Streptomyces odontomachi]|uniref:arginine deiminase family protein n=1 Tax=Streptomyces odontomachi TaxID=2944940 RepID=UPI00210E8A96|nr:arginine deiminase family protein [Streptomyces sp. ODS25]
MPSTTFIVQNPAEVMPVEMALFMEADPPYDPQRAAAESAELRAALAAYGPVVTVRQGLTSVERKEVVRLAEEAVGALDPGRRDGVQQAFAHWAQSDLIDIVLRQPRLELQADPELAAISPDASYESYVLRPLFGLMFPRDHYADLGGPVALGRIRRRDRARETAVMEVLLHHLRGRGADLVPGDGHYLEGGDVAVAEHLAVLGCGFRTSPESADALVPHLASADRQVIQVRDGLKRPEEFHLDHWLSLGPGLALVAEERLDSPAVTATLHRSDTPTGRPARSAEPVTLRRALHETQTRIVPLSPAQIERFAANAFFVPGRRVAVTSRTAYEEVAPLLEPCEIDVVPVPFDEHHKQFGSIHCAVNTVTTPADRTATEEEA